MAAIAIRYELQALEEFVKLQCSMEESEPTPSGKFRRLEQFADAEMKKIRTNMTVQVLSIAKPRHVELYIQHHQVGIIHLSEMLIQFERAEATKRSKPPEQFYIRLQQQLLDLLDFLKHYFEAYFDWHQLVPAFRRRSIVSENFKGYLKILDFNSDEDLEPVLAMIRDYWEPVATGMDEQLTFHREQYFDALYHALALRLYSGCTVSEIVELLLQMNYNDTRFMDYCRMKLVASLADIDELRDKLHFLAERIKQLKQLPLQKLNAFNPANPGIVVYCRHWMEEEYRFLQERQKREVGKVQPENQHQSELKLQTRMTVAQLGIMLQLIYESGAMKIKNKTTYINFFARHLITRDKDSISEKNLRNSYYNIDFKAKEEVKDLLYEMLKILREFNP